jgi:hypothetical protein
MNQNVVVATKKKYSGVEFLTFLLKSDVGEGLEN